MEQIRLPFQAHSPTSEAAAEYIEPKAPSDRARVLDLLQRYPTGFTDEELQIALELNPSTERPRRIELVRASLVRDSGRTRPTRSGAQAVIWIAIPPRKGT